MRAMANIHTPEIPVNRNSHRMRWSFNTTTCFLNVLVTTVRRTMRAEANTQTHINIYLSTETATGPDGFSVPPLGFSMFLSPLGERTMRARVNMQTYIPVDSHRMRWSFNTTTCFLNVLVTTVRRTMRAGANTQTHINIYLSTETATGPDGVSVPPLCFSMFLSPLGERTMRARVNMQTYIPVDNNSLGTSWS